MTERKQFRAVKGTRDILPPDSALWNWFEHTARQVFESYNFREIRLPIFEQTGLFARSVGADTDIVSKEMFTFRLSEGFQGSTKTDEGTPVLGEQVSLRPEATASTMRAYIEHGMHTLPGNVKLYCIGPMFRRERPQKGRYRQFYQVNAEVLGQSDAPAIDTELIAMLMTFFERVGLTRTTLYINSIGDKNCRPQYLELLRVELRKVKDRLGPDSQRRIETNPLRVLDSKLPNEQDIIEKLPRLSDHLCVECREHFAKLKEELKLRGIAYEENWRLVRGLDYYTRTTFEVIAEGLGSQNAVCGGGRYDGLVELLGGPPTKGIGFAIGSDRAILSIQESGHLPKMPGLDVFVAWMGQPAYPAAVAIARKLRDAGLSVELPGEEMKFKKSLNLADKLGARYALMIGSDEVASGTFTLKKLSDGKQDKYSEYDLLEYLESERRGSSD
ncbi:MAG: histidine--tRNA ligase [Candidatus Acidiferrales bacterium]